MKSLLDWALQYQVYGYSVIPIDLATQKPLDNCNVFAQRLPTKEEVIKMFDNLQPDKYGIALYCGKVSGNLEAICFKRDSDAYDKIINSYLNVNKIAEILAPNGKLYFSKNPQEICIPYRHNDINTTSTILAEKLSDNGEWFSFIRTLGNGEYISVFPTANHLLNNYKRLIISTLSFEERNILLEVSKVFNENISCNKKWPVYKNKQDIIQNIAEAYNNSPNGKLYFQECLRNVFYWENDSWHIWRLKSNDKVYGRLHGDNLNRFTVSSIDAIPFQPKLLFEPFDFLVQVKYKNDYLRAAMYVSKTELNNKWLDELLSLEKTAQNVKKSYISIDEEWNEITPFLTIKEEE